MGHSQRLRFDDLRNVFHLIGEICELGQQPPVWRRHMLVRLGELVDAKVGYSFQARPPVENGMATITSFVVQGPDDGCAQTLFSYFFEDGFRSDEFFPALWAPYMKGEHFTARRRELMADEKWYAAPVVQQHCQALGTDDLMCSQYFIGPPYTTQSINLHRDRSDRQFEPRDQRLVQMFHTELGRLWKDKPLPSPDPCDGLSPRMRQIVDLLRSGFVEKEIAVKTKLSVHTVHDYVKRLYAHYGVSNRAGFLSATNPPPVPYRPALSP